jgi:hypothetical protein
MPSRFEGAALSWVPKTVAGTIMGAATAADVFRKSRREKFLSMIPPFFGLL